MSFKLLCFRECDCFFSEEPSIQCIVMAATGVHEEGFYSTLNVVSCLDILPSPLKRKKKATPLYEMERLVASREKETKASIRLIVLNTTRISFNELCILLL